MAADSGAIGGDLSEEFQVIAATGEDAIVYCPDSDYAANMEKAEALAPAAPRAAAVKRAREDADARQEHLRRRGRAARRAAGDHREVAGAGHRRAGRRRQCQEGSQVWLLLLRGDHDMNEIKVSKVPGLDQGFRFATVTEIDDALRLQAGLPRPAEPRSSRSRSSPTARSP